MNKVINKFDDKSLDFYCNAYDIRIFLNHEKGNNSYPVTDLIGGKIYERGYHLSASEQRCRFCGKAKPDVTFRSKAHIVPESLGAKSLFADNYECDSCNKDIFNKYENDLNILLAPFLAINGVKGKNGIKKYKSFDLKSYITVENGLLKIGEAMGSENKTFVDKNKKTFTSMIDVPSFSPKNIYKIIAKVAIELLDESTAKNYSILADYIIKNKTLGFEYFIFCFFPGITIEEITLIGYFLKAKDDSNLPAYVFSLFSGNYSIQIPLFNDDQIKRLDGQTISCNCIPVPTPFDKTEFGEKQVKVYKAVNDTKVERHKITITFSYDNIEPN